MKKIKVEKKEKREELARLMNDRKRNFFSLKYKYLHESPISEFDMLSRAKALDNAKEDSVFCLLYKLKTLIIDYTDECRKQKKEPKLKYKNLLFHPTYKSIDISKKELVFNLNDSCIPLPDIVTVFEVILEETFLNRFTLRFNQFSIVIFYEIPKIITHFRNLLDELASKEEAKKEIFNEFDAVAIEKFAEISL